MELEFLFGKKVMRIYCEDLDKKCDKVTLYLTLEEAEEMRDSLEAIIEKKHHHEHIPDSDFKREITVCVYDKDDLSSFDSRSRKLILDDD